MNAELVALKNRAMDAAPRGLEGPVCAWLDEAFELGKVRGDVRLNAPMREE